jgi:hypothetical protein
MRALLALLACSALLLAGTGCSSYKLGPANTLPFQTVHVALAEDRSYTPQVRVLLTAQLIEELNRSGRVRVVNSRAEAEALLTVTLVSVVRDTSVTQPGDSLLNPDGDSGRPFKLERSFNATLRLEDASGRQVWLDNAEVTTERFTLIAPLTGLANAEFADMPAATRALAEASARAVLGVW